MGIKIMWPSLMCPASHPSKMQRVARLADRGVCEQRIAVSATANYLLSRVFFRHVAIRRGYVPVFTNTGFHDEAEIYQT